MTDRDIPGINAEELLVNMANEVPESAYGQMTPEIGTGILDPLYVNRADGVEPTYLGIFDPLEDGINEAVNTLASACQISSDYAFMLVVDQLLNSWTHGCYKWQKSRVRNK